MQKKTFAQFIDSRLSLYQNKPSRAKLFFSLNFVIDWTMRKMNEILRDNLICEVRKLCAAAKIFLSDVVGLFATQKRGTEAAFLSVCREISWSKQQKKKQKELKNVRSQWNVLYFPH